MIFILPGLLEAILIQNAYFTIYCNAQPEAIKLIAFATDAHSHLCTLVAIREKLLRTTAGLVSELKEGRPTEKK